VCSLSVSFIVQLHCKLNTTNVVCVCMFGHIHTHTYMYTYVHTHIHTHTHTHTHSPPGKVFAHPYSRCSAGMKYKELLDIFLTTTHQ